MFLVRRESPPAVAVVQEPMIPEAFSAPICYDKEVEPDIEDEEEYSVPTSSHAEAFDALTDRWIEPAQELTQEDVLMFSRALRRVPLPERPECVRRALNLVPDENIELLCGILFDKDEPAEIVKEVFNDILNRNDEDKLLILREIIKDKTHPCWADVSWTLDVIGE